MSSLQNDFKQNWRVVLKKKEDVKLEVRPVPEPKEDEVLVAMKAVGICGSDVHLVKSGKLGAYTPEGDFYLGHEGAGTVVQCGPNVSHLQPGDLVALELGRACFRCEFCRRGRYNLCPITDMEFGVAPPAHGCLSTYFVEHADFCHKLPSTLTAEQGALLEPLSVGVHNQQRVGLKLGDALLICGCGPIGLMNLLVARALGAGRIIMTDINNDRLKIAEDLGADVTVMANDSAEETATRVEEANGGEKVDRAVECSGFDISTTAAIYSVKPGGVVCVVGMSHSPTRTLPINYALCREIDIVGSFRYPHCYQKAAVLMAQGLLDPTPLITHRYLMEDIQQAFDTASSGKAIKVMINVP